MPRPNAVVANITSLSAPLEAMEGSQPPSSVTVSFEGGDSGELDLTASQSRLWFEILDFLKRKDRPAYVEIDPNTSAITEVLIPKASPVVSVTPDPSGDVTVSLIKSAALHSLRRNDPNFQEILDILEKAVADGSEVLLAATLDAFEIIYAVALPKAEPREAPQVPPAPSPSVVLEAPVSQQRAKDLYDAMSADTCDVCAPTSTCIPFKYPDDGCYARAHEMCRRMRDVGEDPKKVWIFGSLQARTANIPGCHTNWGWHVAPTLLVDTPLGQETHVIDPSLCYEPVTVERWKAIQDDPNATIQHTTWEKFWPNGGTDPDFSQTEFYLEEKRIYLKARCGQIPYAQCVADVYLRDNLQDTGVEPLAGGGISTSPDISHFRQELAYPQGVLGTLTARGQDTLFEPVEIGQPNYIYLRLQNRGWTAAAVDVNVYYSLPSTLPTPSGWHLIGSLTPPPIVPLEFKVVGPIVWNTIPQLGHYCFVVVLGKGADPMPDFSSIDTLDEFYDFVKAHNNVTWKNFDVYNMFAGSRQSFEFSIQGWPRIAYLSDLEVDLSALPAGCHVELELLKRLTDGALSQGMTKVKETYRHATFEVQPYHCGALCNMPLNTSDRSEAKLTVTLPDNTPDGAYQVSVRQIVSGREMGRVTKRLVVGSYPYVVNSNSDEVHLANCAWVQKMNPTHRVAYSDLELARRHGHNGCRYCLPEIDTG